MLRVGAVGVLASGVWACAALCWVACAIAALVVCVVLGLRLLLLVLCYETRLLLLLLARGLSPPPPGFVCFGAASCCRGVASGTGNVPGPPNVGGLLAYSPFGSAWILGSCCALAVVALAVRLCGLLLLVLGSAGEVVAVAVVWGVPAAVEEAAAVCGCRYGVALAGAFVSVRHAAADAALACAGVRCLAAAVDVGCCGGCCGCLRVAAAAAAACCCGCCCCCCCCCFCRFHA